MKPPHEFVRVYVWEAPVRLFHWINVLALLALAVTGLIIGHPPALMSSQSASGQYWFAEVRFVHFVAGYVFVAALLLRVYWAFAGNKFARWRNFLPLTRRQWREMLQVGRTDVLQITDEPVEGPGHNAVAYFTYLGAFCLALIQIATGFALYSDASAAWWPRLFRWIVPLLGGERAVRLVHYDVTWLFLIFTVIHVYLCAYHDFVEGHGVISSIIGGWKFMDRRAAAAPHAHGITSLSKKSRS